MIQCSVRLGITYIGSYTPKSSDNFGNPFGVATIHGNPRSETLKRLLLETPPNSQAPALRDGAICDALYEGGLACALPPPGETNRNHEEYPSMDWFKGTLMDG